MFLALFNREKTTKEEYLAALAVTFEDMLAGRVRIVTCTLIRTEMFPNRMKAEGQAFFNELMACPSFEMVETLSNVMELAGEIRGRCLDAKPHPVKLKAPDSIHAAAAHITKVDEMWTTDDQLLRGYANGLVTTTKVCCPHLKQTVLLLLD